MMNWADEMHEKWKNDPKYKRYCQELRDERMWNMIAEAKEKRRKIKRLSMTRAEFRAALMRAERNVRNGPSWRGTKNREI